MKSLKTKITVLSVCVLITMTTIYFLFLMVSYTSLFPFIVNPSDADIDNFGRDKFVKKALEYKSSNIPDKELIQMFSPKRIEVFGEGVLLVYAENQKYIKGLYVDPNMFSVGIYGSGVCIKPQSNHIGWALIKKRIFTGSNIKAPNLAHSIYSNDYNISLTEPNK